MRTAAEMRGPGAMYKRRVGPGEGRGVDVPVDEGEGGRRDGRGAEVPVEEGEGTGDRARA